MTLESEMLVERRLVWRRLSLWRTLAVILGLALLVALLARGNAGGIHADHIARVDISGMILDDARQQELLKELQTSSRVKAVILHINSPGGTTTGGEALYQRIRRLAGKKPVVAVFGTVAASAAYMAGIGADHIVTRGSTITGSVGVIVQWPDMSRLLTRLGITMEELKSGKLKATPTPFKKATSEELAPMNELVKDTFDWFVTLVRERRNLKPGEVPGLAQGRVYTGRQAVRYALADEIGGEDEALAWLQSKKGIAAGIPVMERKVKREFGFDMLASVLKYVSARLGLEHFFALTFAGSGLLSNQGPAGTGASSNGLLSLWQLSGQAERLKTPH